MNSFKIFLCVFLTIFSVDTLATEISAPDNHPGKDKSNDSSNYYKPTWESLADWTLPKWFDDAVFGIYYHWGPMVVPAFDGPRYGLRMYMPDRFPRIYKHHLEHYDKPWEFGFKDLIPLWKAQKWDPDRWADLFENAGADFAGSIAEHHDGFSLWDTEYNKFNAADMGPKRDIVGEMVQAVRAHGMKTIITFHNVRTWKLWAWAHELCPEGVDANNPKYYDLYTKPHKIGEPEPPSYWKRWYNKMIEVVDKYQPDMIWHDGMSSTTRMPDKYKKEYLAHYFNVVAGLGKEGLVSHKHREFRPSCSIKDNEYHPGKDKWEITSERWLADTPIGHGWAYHKGYSCEKVNYIIDQIVDRTSKNGVTLIGLTPKANGLLPKCEIEALKKIGNWMDVNKEALHGAKPTPLSQRGIDTYKSETLRFTEKGAFLYAIDLEEPSAPKIIPDVTPLSGSNIRLLGSKEDLDWHQRGNDLVIEEIPNKLPCKYAWSFKIRVAK